MDSLKRLGDGTVRAVVERGPEVVSSRVGGGGEGGTWTQTDKTQINFTICCCKIPLCSGHLAARKKHIVLNISSSFIVYIALHCVPATLTGPVWTTAGPTAATGTAETALLTGTGDTRGPVATPRPGPETTLLRPGLDTTLLRPGLETTLLRPEETNLPDWGARGPGEDTTLAPVTRPGLETGPGLVTLPVRGREGWAPPNELETRPPELETTPPGPEKALLEKPLLLKTGRPANTEFWGRVMRAGPGREGALRKLAPPALIFPKFWAEGRVSPSPKTQTKTVRLCKYRGNGIKLI